MIPGGDKYVWLVWALVFLIPWGVLYAAFPGQRRIMLLSSLLTSLFGLTEPIFVPEYWNPPSLFDLAQRTGFDIESLIYAFAIGGIGTVLYHALTRQHLVPISAPERAQPRHRFHRAALLAPFVLFGPLYVLPWNPIYPAITCLVIGGVASVICRPDLKGKILISGTLFLGLYTVFMLGLLLLAPGYIEQVWNLSALSGGLIGTIPLEELLFGFAFGVYWGGVYEHFTWSKSAMH